MNREFSTIFWSIVVVAVVQSSSSVAYDWGPWTAWSVCSESCGYGTAYRIRQCHAQLRDGKACDGPDKQYQICNRQPCGADNPDYRTRECAKHNDIFYGQRRYRWLPYINDMAPCELSCKSVGYGYYARFKKTVIDGVTCNEENTAICRSGACVVSGCDGIIGSGTTLDRCGVCGGDGSSCRMLSGIFARAQLTHRGYNIVTTIPAGACSINVTELRRSKNHLALSTPQGYILNGNMRLQAEGEVKGAGTVFTYKRRDGQGCPGECLTAPGPLNTSLRVELIYFGRNPGIFYQYTVPMSSNHQVNVQDSDALANMDDDLQYPPSTYTDRRRPHSNTGSRSSTNRPVADIIPRIKHGPSPRYIPNPDTQRRRESLQNRNARPDIQSAVSSSSSSRYSSPTREDSKTRLDNSQITDGDGGSGTDSQESRSPIQPQIRIRDSKRRRDRHQTRHEHRKDINSRTDVDGRYNSERDFERQNSVESGNSRRSNTGNVAYAAEDDQYYIPSANGSIQYQHYYHTNVHDGLENVPVASPANTNGRDAPWANNAVSDANRYAEFRSTTQYQPPSYDNNHPNVISAPVGPAPPRSSSVDAARNYVTNRRDYLDNRLPSYRTDSNLYSWRIAGFTPCSEPCGGGLQKTRIVCVKSDTQVEVIEENCNPSLKPQETTVICNDEPCDANWSLSPWSECSVTCGRGVQKRVVQCEQRISSTLTIPVSASTCPRPKPQSRQYCQLEDCFLWKPSNWTKCSSECGLGQRSRTLRCEDRKGEAVSDRLCHRLEKPSVEEICDMGSCAQGWFHSRWSKECSTECGRGHHTRQVYCSAPDGSRLHEDKCGGIEKKPRETKSCKSKRPCGGKWFTGPWSKCNATCGEDGYKEREVLCIKRHGKRVNQVAKAHNCDKSEKPPEREWCGKQEPCEPQWYMTSWSKCSKPCGTGVRTREVKCLDTTLTPSPECNKSRKPSRRQSCNPQACDSPNLSSAQSPWAENDTISTESNEAFQMDDQSSVVAKGAECDDEKPTKWCYAAAQARLCNYPHYQNVCCKTCQLVNKSATKYGRG